MLLYHLKLTRTFSKPPNSLADHLATLLSYLNEYHAIEQTSSGVNAQRAAEHHVNAFDKFTHYLIYASLPRLRMRSKHSSSRKFLACLFSIKVTSLEHAIKALLVKIEGAGQTGDLALCDEFLASPQTWGILDTYMKTNLSETDLESRVDPEFKALRKAMQEVHAFHNSGVDPSNSKPPSPSLYSPATITDFHHLLLCILSGFRYFLEQLSTATPGGQDRRDMYQLAWLFTFLLWRVAHSSILREHLALLHSVNLLLPRAGSTESRPGDAKENPDWEHHPTEDDMAGIPQDAEDDDMGLTFLRWIRLLVSHVTALEMLSLFSKQKKIHVKLIELRPADIEEKVPWRPVLKKALGTDEAYLEKVVHVLVKFISQPAEGGKQRTDFLKHFEVEIMRVTGVLHCESVLVALIRYLRLARAVATGTERSISDEMV